MLWLGCKRRARTAPSSTVDVTSDVQKKKSEKKGVNDAVLEQERDQLANALERLADVQRELAEGQRSLMTGPHSTHACCVCTLCMRFTSCLNPNSAIVQQRLTASDSMVLFYHYN